MSIKEVVHNTLVEALQAQGVAAPAPLIEFPADLAHGDYTTNAALQYAKQLSVSPRALAEAIAPALREVNGVREVSVAGPGFINITLAPSEVYAMAVQAGGSNRWGVGTAREGEKVMVEYTDPNPFKEFHIGHLMSNTIGESIARLIENQGAQVMRANWQGDVGPHVAKALWGKLQKPTLAWGAAYAYGAQHYDERKEEIDAINKKVYEKSDLAIQELYAKGRAESLAHFETLYKALGTKFDYYFFEGIEGLEGAALVRQFLEKGVFTESNGAVVFAGEQYGLHTRVFLTAKGLPTYEAKELGLNQAKFQKEPNLDQSIIITANEQSSYFTVVLKAMSFVLPTVAEKTMHIAHGMMKLPSGKMSSRTGDVITGESLLADISAEAAKRAAEEGEALAQQVAVAAIKYQILKQSTGKDIVFDRERALSLEGDSGPYLQYTHARCASLLQKAPHQPAQGTLSAQGASVDSKGTETVWQSDVARLLVRYPHVTLRAANEYAPHYVAQYLLELASSFNHFYASEKIVGSEDEQAKLLVVQAVHATLAKGLYVLGITAPDKM